MMAEEPNDLSTTILHNLSAEKEKVTDIRSEEPKPPLPVTITSGVRVEHILEIKSSISNAEQPSMISRNLFIGGALAARSVHTLQRLGISHVLCLCANEIGQSDSQCPDLFEYQNFSVCDTIGSNISDIFGEACDFIDYVERMNGRVLVHCFEGRSRSATVVMAYLMIRKNFTLLQAWNTLKRVHPRARPNRGFAWILQDLDQKVHGRVSMEWRVLRRPAMKVCSICGKMVGLSSRLLMLHSEKWHKVSPGSAEGTTTMAIQKGLAALEISGGGGGSVRGSPKERQPLSPLVMENYRVSDSDPL